MAKTKTEALGIEMERLLIENDEFVVGDIETTTRSPHSGGMIIEIGAVKIKNSEIIDRFTQLINPERKLYKKTIDLTGITNDMIKDKPTFDKVLPKFKEFIGDSVVVFHNATFDWHTYLNYFFKKLAIFPQNSVIDTLILSKKYFPNESKHNLKILSERLDISLEGHHRALNDAETTAKILIKLKNNYAPKQISKPKDNASAQLSLFNITTHNNDDSSKKSTSEEKTDINIIRIKYWEKEIKKGKFIRRIYVTLNCGVVYFDLDKRNWLNKDVEISIDMKKIHNLVLKRLNLNSTIDLCNYRG